MRCLIASTCVLYRVHCLSASTCVLDFEMVSLVSSVNTKTTNSKHLHSTTNTARTEQVAVIVIAFVKVVVVSNRCFFAIYLNPYLSSLSI